MPNLDSIDRIAERMLKFDHPIINPSLSLVEIISSSLNSRFLSFNLYDRNGIKIIDDVYKDGTFILPGLLIKFEPYNGRIHIETIYFKPEYHGRKLGTTWTNLLLEYAAEEKYRKVTLIADETTNALDYWKKIHDFRNEDPEFPQKMQKIILTPARYKAMFSSGYT